MSSIIAGKYEVVRKLGKGGAGTVYLVRHIDRGTEYAMKLLSLSSDQRAISRFKQEAAVLEKFSHPGSVQLRDFGKTEDGTYYMTTDFSDGALLKEVVKEYGPQRLLEIIECGEQILSVLSAAHALGIIHRDIKPENTMVEDRPDGSKVYRVLDFGIAKFKETGFPAEAITLEGSAIGTPQYMSPEQAAGDTSLDHRVDIYAVGIMLYELITGRVPFKGETLVQTLLMQSTKAPPPFAAALGIPENVEKVLFKALEKDRNKRYSDADAFSKALSALRQEVAASGPAICPLEDPNEAAPATAANEGFKILVLDDDPAVLTIMKHLLEKEGYQVFPTSNCSSIHDLIFSEKVRFMISDVQMPGLPGPKICQMLKDSLKDITIMLFSSIDEHELEQAAKASRADAWMSKQWKPQEWVSKVNEIVETRRAKG